MLRLPFISIFFLLSLCLVFLRTTCTAVDGKAGHNSSVVTNWQGCAEVDFLHASFCFFMKTIAEGRKQSQNSAVSPVFVRTCGLAVVEAQALNAGLVISLGGGSKAVP